MNSKQWVFYKNFGYFIKESYGTHKGKKVPNEYSLVKRISNDRLTIALYLNKAAAKAVVKRFGFIMVKDEQETALIKISRHGLRVYPLMRMLGTNIINS